MLFLLNNIVFSIIIIIIINHTMEGAKGRDRDLYLGLKSQQLVLCVSQTDLLGS